MSPTTTCSASANDSVGTENRGPSSSSGGAAPGQNVRPARTTSFSSDGGPAYQHLVTAAEKRLDDREQRREVPGTLGGGEQHPHGATLPPPGHASKTADASSQAVSSPSRSPASWTCSIPSATTSNVPERALKASDRVTFLSPRDATAAVGRAVASEWPG